MIRIDLSPQGDTAVLKLTSYLGPDLFAKYRDLCYRTGARYAPDLRANLAPLGSLPQIIRELDEAGFGVETAPEIAARLREQADEARALLDAGRSRLEEAEARISPKGLSLFRFQRTGIEWLAPRDRALLCDEMGLGKTVQALLALPGGASALVLVPASVRFNWAAEIRRWRPDLRVAMIAGAGTFRWPAEGEIAVASYGMLPPTQKEIEEDAGKAEPGLFGTASMPVPPVGCCLLADEAHLLKNPRTNRSRRFAALKDQVLAYRGRIWLLTGTPLLNRPPELWALLKAAGLAEESFGNWHNFCRLFAASKGDSGYEWGKPSDEVPLALRKVSLHRLRAEVLRDLPAKQRRDVEVNGLDAATISLCDEVVSLLRAKGIDLETLAGDVDQTKLAGAAFEKMSAARAALATAKIPALLERVEEYEDAEEPLVVFSCHKAPVEALAAREGWRTITGATSSEERQEIVEAFRRGELRGVAGTITAMGTGVRFERAAHAVMVDLAWTPAINSQAEDRLMGITQKRGVFIYRLVARHALDERVLELITIKQEIIDASVTASAVGEDFRPESPAEALLSAAESAEESTTRMADRKREHEKADEARKAEVRRSVEEDLKAKGLSDGREIRVNDLGTQRGPANAREDAAGNALITLAGLDPDRALALNGVGFSRLDGDFGHSLAEQYRKRGMLSERQWLHSVKMATKYRRQVGELPPLPGKEAAK